MLVAKVVSKVEPAESVPVDTIVVVAIATRPPSLPSGVEKRVVKPRVLVTTFPSESVTVVRISDVVIGTAVGVEKMVVSPRVLVTTLPSESVTVVKISEVVIGIAVGDPSSPPSSSLPEEELGLPDPPVPVPYIQH